MARFDGLLNLKNYAYPNNWKKISNDTCTKTNQRYRIGASRTKPDGKSGAYFGASNGQLADPGEANTRKDTELEVTKVAAGAPKNRRPRPKPTNSRTGRQIHKGFAMQAALSSAAVSAPQSSPQQFPPLELEMRPTVPTAQAAHYLNRRPQTLRQWACFENGPVRPIRVHGLLAWPMADIRRVLGVCQ